ncbi:cysteine--tRNA ligase [Patescibacteria group bacterium]|nr:cysteine--tRNA ligase [Patescibacteria group bacterium]
MLKLFNTMSRQLEDFEPLNDKEVTFYSCGPTVYDYAHIGNLRTYIFSDILKRVLLFDGYNVKHVMNITDVGHLTEESEQGEDKIERSARMEAKSALEIADFYAQAFKDDLRKLNIIEPNIWCKATDHINEQIELIKKLEEKGHVYKTSDGIYFDTSKVKDYGKLARLNLEGLEEGSRVDVNIEKKNPTDFALWKFSPQDKQRQMEWDSPWGKGFPGWHAECSAMSMKYLGETIDIHTGGIDHIPVHHTNEIAQSEAATGKPFVRFWAHGDFLLINEGKMAKSLGNFITLNTLPENGFDPIVYRIFCLSSHYRSKLNFSWEALEGAKNTWLRLKRKFLDLGRQTGEINVLFLEKFKTAVNDDLGMPQALAVFWEVFKSNISDFDKHATLLEFDKVLGLNLAELKEEQAVIPGEIMKLMEERKKARENKKWQKADELRKKIEDLGYEVEDTAQETHVRKK